MSYVLTLAARSAWNRRLTLGTTLVAIALSVTLLAGVERLRHDARESFATSVSGTDLVVGPRGSAVQLMLYAVFRTGEATSNMRWKSFGVLESMPEVAWAVPLSLGDSHRGFAVLGTSPAYFRHFRYGADHSLRFAQGKPFDALFEAVIGADVAERLGYRVGDKVALSHGTGEIALSEHADKPFSVTGVLERTGTPVDRTVHVSLQAIEAIHLDWQGGAPIPGVSIPAQFVTKFDLTPREITAALVGLKNRADVFRVQRRINQHADEALTAALPGVALDELWQTIGIVERVLLAVSSLVVAVGLAGLVAVLLAGLNERRRELAVLRSVGARPRDVFLLLCTEGVMVAAGGTLLGLLLLAGVAEAAGPLLQARFGIELRTVFLAPGEWLVICAVIGTALLASLVPGYRAYRVSLADGLAPRL